MASSVSRPSYDLPDYGHMKDNLQVFANSLFTYLEERNRAIDVDVIVQPNFVCDIRCAGKAVWFISKSMSFDIEDRIERGEWPSFRRPLELFNFLTERASRPVSTASEYFELILRTTALIWELADIINKSEIYAVDVIANWLVIYDNKINEEFYWNGGWQAFQNVCQPYAAAYDLVVKEYESFFNAPDVPSNIRISRVIHAHK